MSEISAHDANVSRGIEFLDATLGRHVWLPRVDFATLDVRTSERCLACQATGVDWYGDAVESLGVSLQVMQETWGGVGSWTEAHGFGISLDRVERSEDRDFDGLTETWRRRVNLLRAEVTT